MSAALEPRGLSRAAETIGAWVLGLLWVLPLAYTFWTAFHPPEFSARFYLLAPLSIENFVRRGSRLFRILIGRANLASQRKNRRRNYGR